MNRRIRVVCDGYQFEWDDRNYLIHISTDVMTDGMWVAPGPNIFITVQELIEMLFDYQRGHLWELPEPR